MYNNVPRVDMNAYNRDGFYVLTDVLSPDMCDTLHAEAQRIEAEAASNFRPLMQIHRQNKIMLEAMKNPAVIAELEHLVSGPVSGIQSEFFFSKKGTRGFAKHQDNFFVEAPDDAFASAWMALCDVTPENGALTVWPGTHKCGRLPVTPLNSIINSASQDPNANNEETVVPAGYESFPVSVKKGSVLFIHANLVHASNENTTTDFRPVLLCTYLRQGSPFRPGNHAKRAEVDMYQNT